MVMEDKVGVTGGGELFVAEEPPPEQAVIVRLRITGLKRKARTRRDAAKDDPFIQATQRMNFGSHRFIHPGKERVQMPNGQQNMGERLV